MTLSTETACVGFAVAKRRASWLGAQLFRGDDSVALAPDGGTVPDPYGAAAGANRGESSVSIPDIVPTA